MFVICLFICQDSFLQCSLDWPWTHSSSSAVPGFLVCTPLGFLQGFRILYYPFCWHISHLLCYLLDSFFQSSKVVQVPSPMLNPISSFCSVSCICQHHPFSLLIRDLTVTLHSLVNATLWLHSQTFNESSEVRQQFLP